SVPPDKKRPQGMRAALPFSSQSSFGSGDAARRPRTESKESQRAGAVADQQVFGLLIMLQCLFVGFAADTGFLVATEGGVGRVGVVAVGPDAACLNAPAHAVGAVH